MLNINFNSIKVRLNQPSSISIPVNSSFQFHKGTIKPFKALQLTFLQLIFQFHKGTIKPAVDKLQNAGDLEFQFHKGTIKPMSLSYDTFEESNFNSIKVRLNL